MADCRYNENTAVGRPESAVKGHGQSAGDGRSGNTGRNHPKRVRRRIGNRSLGNKRQPHNIVDIGRLPLLCRKPVFKKCGAERYRDRRHHTAGHDRRHDIKAFISQRRSSENVGGFVEGTAHVNGHHTAQNGAENDFTRTAHGRKNTVHPDINSADKRIDKDHNKAHYTDTSHRINEHRLHPFQAFGQPAENLLQKPDNISGQKSGQKGA